MKIRSYSSEDRDQVITLWQNVFSDDSPHNDPSKVIDAKLAIDELLFVAEDNDVIIGTAMAGYDGHRGWLYLVAVDPQQRRKGIGFPWPLCNDQCQPPRHRQVVCSLL